MNKRRISLTVISGILVEAINKIFPLFIIAYAVRILGTEGFGYGQYGIAMIELCLPLVIFGYNSMALIRLGKLGPQSCEAGELVSSIQLVKLVHALLIYASLVFITFCFDDYFRYRSLAIYLGLFLFPAALELSWVQVGTQKLLYANMFLAFSKLISMISIIIFVQGPDDALLYAILTLSANGLTGILAMIYGLTLVKIRTPSLQTIRTVFLASLPFALVVVFGGLLDRIEVAIVERLFGTVGVATYMGPMRVAASLLHVVNSLAAVFLSEAVALKAKQDVTRHFNLAIWAGFALLMPIMVGVWFVDEQILLLLFGEEFAGHGIVLSILTMGCSVYFLNNIACQLLLVNDRPLKASLAIGCGALSLIAATVAWSNEYGIVGIALGVCTGRLVAASLAIYLARAYVRFPWHELTSSLVPALGMGAFLTILGTQDLVVTVLGGAVVYCLVFYLFNRERVRNNVGGLVKRKFPDHEDEER